MSNPLVNLTNITAPRVPFIDERTNLISREWYRFLLSLFQLTGSGTSTVNLTDLQVGPPNPEYGPIITGGTNGVAIPLAGAIAYGDGVSYAFTAVGTATQVLTSAGSGTPTWSSPATGSVTSVGLTAPAIFTVTGSPVTSSGTLALTYSGTALPVLNGGTGSTTNAGAAFALKGANADITSITGLTTALSAGQGGTAQSTWTTGDLLYASAANTLSKLGVGTTGQVLKVTAGIPAWDTDTVGTGTVTSVSVVSANGMAGTVATASTTPAITLTTTVTGVLKGNGTAISAAVVNTDFVAPSAPVTKTADFTVAATESYLINNKTTTSCVVTLPTASSWSGRSLNFTNYQAQTLVSASSNVVARTGGAAGTAILAATVGAWAQIVSDGSNWLTIAGS